MNTIEQQKIKAINNYMSLIDIDENIDYKKIEFELASLLGEKPAVQLEYKDETFLNEDGKEAKKINKLKSINIFYTYEDNGILKFGKKTYIIA